MGGSRYYRYFAGMLILILAQISLCASQANAAQTVSPVNPNGEELETSYWQHSMHRNDIACRLNDLWRQEKNLKLQYEMAGRSDEQVDFNQLARQLKQTREEIDSLRGLLSQENQVIARIGALIPD